MELHPYLFCLPFYLLYFFLPPFKDNGLLCWVPDVLCRHSEVVLWNLLSVQMFFWWICVGENDLPILFLHHLRTAPKNSLLDSLGEGYGGMIWEGSFETCILSYVKQIACPGSTHETGCSGLVHWDDPEGWDGEGGGRGVVDGEHVCACCWFMSMYGKNHYNIPLQPLQ